MLFLRNKFFAKISTRYFSMEESDQSFEIIESDQSFEVIDSYTESISEELFKISNVPENPKVKIINKRHDVTPAKKSFFEEIKADLRRKGHVLPDWSRAPPQSDPIEPRNPVEPVQPVLPVKPSSSRSSIITSTPAVGRTISRSDGVNFT